jgi:HSP20 family protein
MNSDVKQFFAELSESVSEDAQLQAHVHSADEELRGADATELGDERDGQLAIDVYEKGHAIVVEAPIAGVNSDDIDIHITNESLTIRGKRHREHTVKDKDYLFQECYWGRFSRSLILPEEIDADRAEATIKNGVLRVTMPKLHSLTGKKVRVKLE